MSSAKFWLEEPKQLFLTKKVLPHGSCSPEDQWNAVTRLALIIFLVLILATSISNSLWFLTISIFLIILLYYLQRKMSRPAIIEYYEPNPRAKQVFDQV